MRRARQKLFYSLYCAAMDLKNSLDPDRDKGGGRGGTAPIRIKSDYRRRR
ncbi:MAG: hypothetical protein IME99_05180 [Proteobacteria bacterium]|nr:hypothetical protein [Pseudomonadota bacterium]